MNKNTNTKDKIKIAIIGASGYTGVELIRLLLNHSRFKITYLTADTKAGVNICDVFPHLEGFNLPKLIKINEVDFSNVDAVFCCVPHGTTHNIISKIPTKIKICDLSADFRFQNTTLYEEIYKVKHTQKNLQLNAIYGLTELYREEVKKARLVACPGCYPTSVLLPLIPLLKRDIIKTESIIVDSKSGVTGAGRTARESLLFSEVSEKFSAYGLTNHRHKPEIETQILNFSEDNEINISFTPHLLPIKRGILSTIYFDSYNKYSINDIKDCLYKTYDKEPFISVLKNDNIPSTSDVRGSNFCKIGVFFDKHNNKNIIISVLDNLVKGASGQAIQNMNIMMGIDEREGLMGGVEFP